MSAVRTGSLVAALAMVPLALALADPRIALAYEDQAGLALGAGYAALASVGPASPAGHGLPEHGFVIHAAGAVGLGDTFELRVLASWAMYLGDTPLHRITGGVEVVYLLDILEWVPFIGIGVDVPTSIHALGSGGNEVWVDFTGHAVVGVDWLPSREFTIGVEVRPSVNFTSLPTDPVGVAAILRAQLLFEL